MAEAQEDTNWCKNCKRDIASANFLMHEVHCHRNIILCEHCKEPVPRTELDEHFDEYHAPVKCDLCSRSFPKEDLESHKDNDCPKRTLKCVYCELEMPQCELQQHLDYCGTRTEMCLKCKQYVMHKDLMQHEESDCITTASNSKGPKNTNGALNGRGLDSGFGTFGRESDAGFGNTFAMDELSRILDEPSLRGPRIPGGGGARRGSHLSSLARPNNMRSMQNRSDPGSPSQLHMRNDIQGTSRRRPAAPATRKATNRRETKNLDRERGRSNLHRETHTGTSSSSGSYGNNLDMDFLLAMHMDNDLNNYVPGESAPEPSGFVSVQESSGDTVLPCEFCDELVPVEDLIQHQTACNPSMFDTPPDPSGSLTSVNNDIALPNNSPSRPLPPGGTRAQPHIVDNLSYMAAHNRMANADLNDLHLNPGLDDDIMLPCEFCDNLLPEDILIQHQAVCEKNMQKTPRLSPVGPATRIHHQNNSQRSRPSSQRSTPMSRPFNHKNMKSNVRYPVQTDNLNSFQNPSERDSWRPQQMNPDSNHLGNHRPGPMHNSQFNSFHGANRSQNETHRKKNNRRVNADPRDDASFGPRRGNSNRERFPRDSPSYEPEDDRRSTRGGRPHLPRSQIGYSRGSPAAQHHRQNDPNAITGTSYRRKSLPREVQPQMEEDYNGTSGHRNPNTETRGRSRGGSSRSRMAQGRGRRYPQGDV